MTREEAIFEYRRKDDDGEFDKKIISRKPKDVRYDTATLECGHIVDINASMLKLSAFATDKFPCSKCQDAWMIEHGLKSRPHGE